jgi:hypothetical protein
MERKGHSTYPRGGSLQIDIVALGINEGNLEVAGQGAEHIEAKANSRVDIEGAGPAGASAGLRENDEIGGRLGVQACNGGVGQSVSRKLLRRTSQGLAGDRIHKGLKSRGLALRNGTSDRHSNEGQQPQIRHLGLVLGNAKSRDLLTSKPHPDLSMQPDLVPGRDAFFVSFIMRPAPSLCYKAESGKKRREKKKRLELYFRKDSWLERKHE